MSHHLDDDESRECVANCCHFVAEVGDSVFAPDPLIRIRKLLPGSYAEMLEIPPKRR